MPQASISTGQRSGEPDPNASRSWTHKMVLSGRKDAGRDGFIESRTSAWPRADPLLVTIGPVARFLAATRCRAGFHPPATFVRDTFLLWRPSCRAAGPGRRWT